MSSDYEQFTAAMQQRTRDGLKCSYDTTRGRGAHGVGCVKGRVTREVTIIYNPGVYGRDVVHTCDECFKTLKKLVRRQGYKLESKRI